MIEEWRSVVGLEGCYEVSNMGNVRSLDRKITYTRFGKAETKFFPAKPLSITYVRGYAKVYLMSGGPGRPHFVHRLVLEAFVGPCQIGHETRHINNVRSDNSLSNLAWGTHAENEYDRATTGTVLRGESNANSRYTEDNIKGIRDGRITRQEAHDLLGMSFPNYHYIKNRTTWRHV